MSFLRNGISKKGRISPLITTMMQEMKNNVICCIQTHHAAVKRQKAAEAYVLNAGTREAIDGTSGVLVDVKRVRAVLLWGRLLESARVAIERVAACSGIEMKTRQGIACYVYRKCCRTAQTKMGYAFTVEGALHVLLHTEERECHYGQVDKENYAPVATHERINPLKRAAAGARTTAMCVVDCLENGFAEHGLLLENARSLSHAHRRLKRMRLCIAAV
jgi:hypothetical protein